MCSAAEGTFTTGDLAAQRPIKDEGPERNDRRHEREQRAAEWPVALAPGAVQRSHEHQKEQTMHAAHDAHGERKARQILEWHRDEYEGQERRAFKERNEPELAKHRHDADDGPVGRDTISVRLSGSAAVSDAA